MATDYDAPRKTEEDQSEESIEELKARRHDKNSGKVDEDEAEAAESFELPGADLSHEELAVEVMPRQEDEFTCMSFFSSASCERWWTRKQLMQVNSSSCRGMTSTASSSCDRSAPGSSKDSAASASSSSTLPEFLSCRRALSSSMLSSLWSSSVLRGAS